MEIQIFDNRIDMVNALIKENAEGCELGVFAGEFAETLYRRNPRKLTLVDSWQGDRDTGMLFSGDQDGNNGVQLHQEVLYNMVVERFKSRPNVRIWRGYTELFIPRLAESSLDFVYIDADHSYEGVLRDLRLLSSKMRPDGLIMGHDYEMNMDKAKILWNFEVKKAVDQFCSETTWRICAFARDGCVSFCLKRVHMAYLSSSTTTPANL